MKNVIFCYVGLNEVEPLVAAKFMERPRADFHSKLIQQAGHAVGRF